nr:transporter substrate-binding domain-containing protein [Candidatus Dependentiae bacterium]
VISPLNEINPTTLGSEALVKYADFAYGFLFNGAIPVTVTPATVFAYLSASGSGRVTGWIANSFEGDILGVLGISDQVFPDVASAVAALKAGTITALFSNTAVVNFAARNDTTLAALDNAVLPADTRLNPFRSTGLGIGINPTCCQLFVNVRAAIAAMVADGTYAKLAAANGVPTTFGGAGSDVAPAGCTITTPQLVVRNAISSFLFDRFCACVPTVGPVTPVTTPVTPVTR